jgi:hypothetical protein
MWVGVMRCAEQRLVLALLRALTPRLDGLRWFAEV